MNSTIQCLYKVPELRESLAGYAAAGAFDASHKLTLATKQLFGVMTLLPYQIMLGRSLQ